MTAKARELLESALKLPKAERRKLAHEILESVDELDDDDSVALEPAFVKELGKRLADEPPSGERWPTVHEVVDRLRRDLELGPPRAKKRARGG